MVYKVKIILIFLIMIGTISIAYFSAPRSKFIQKIPRIDSEKKYRVTKVFDGDTFEIKIGKEIKTVRMLGIDTPETVDPRKPVQCFGKEASDMTKKMLAGHSVTLEIDPKQSLLDKFGRVLAYTRRDDGVFINEFLLQNGYAREYTYGKAYKLQKEFKALEKTAQDQKAGLWKYCNDVTK